MDKLQIRGGQPLHGKLYIGGAKNSVLPLMGASLLTDEPTVLSNVPALADVKSMAHLLTEIGCHIEKKMTLDHQYSHQDIYTIAPSKNILTEAPYDIVRKMRASIVVLGPLLARHGHAEISLPGGCAIGTRPIDLHLKAFAALGADIMIDNGYVKASAPKGLVGGEFTFPIISVTGTMNMLMAATLADGTTIIRNAAREPEVTDLVNFLNQMGAKITGDGTDTITIEGVPKLHGTTYRVMPDRIETGTYAMAAAITGGELEIVHGNLSCIPATVEALKNAGVTFEILKDSFRVKAPKRLRAVDITTAPYPGYATDLQAQMMALMTVAEGTSTITETIFENRFMHVPELNRLGADIHVNGSSATVKGVRQLKGADVMATDLRASVSLVLAALAAEGDTIIHRIYHLDRGYEHIEAKLQPCGAQIQRIA